MGIAILVIMIYYPLFVGCEAMAMERFLPPQYIMWLPNAVFGAIGGFLTYRICAS
jgi:lipopolysaccharide export LptBFGC system permease protein LptF